MEWKNWIKKKVFIVLKNNRQYSGTVLSIDDGWISLIDKFGSSVMITLSEVKLIEEDDEGKKYGKNNS